MATFLLVHGAWEAGWIWRDVASRLCAGGHEVYRPTLTGLGERSHLSSPAIDIETHIADILGVIRWERLTNVTLVGHSYGGMVITGVADRAFEKIGSLLYLDAFVPKNGQSLRDLVAPARAAEMLKLANEQGAGEYLPVAAAPIQNITNPNEAALLNDFCVAMPLATVTQKLMLVGNHLKVPKKAYVFASGYAFSPFARFAEEAGALGWPVEKLPTHHCTMISMPKETAEVLVRYAF